MSPDINTASTELVEQLAREAYEQRRARNLIYPEPAWEDAPAIEKHHGRQAVLAALNLLLPALQAHGWLPPAKHDAIRETVRDLSVNELHKSLMNSLMIDRENSGHTTQEGLNGYSEGAEHGTISLASRIKTILDGEA